MKGKRRDSEAKKIGVVPRGRKGVTITLSTVIMLAAMLVIVSSVLYLSTSILEGQAEQLEFENAQNNMLYLADVIEQVSPRPGASGYVQFNTRASGPSFERIHSCFKVEILGNSTYTPIDETQPLLAVIFRGGSLIGVSGYEALRGDDNLIVWNNTGPTSWVYLEQKDGARIVLTVARVKVNYLGVYNFSKPDGSWTCLNWVEIVYIKLVSGVFGGSGTINVYIKNNGLAIERKQLSVNEFTITVTRGSDIESEIVKGSSTVTVGASSYPVDGTLINLVCAEVKVSTRP